MADESGLDDLKARLAALEARLARGEPVQAEIEQVMGQIVNLGGEQHVGDVAQRDFYKVVLPGEDPAAARARYHTYLRWLVSRWGVLPLSTIDLLQEEQVRLALVWTPLDVLETRRDERSLDRVGMEQPVKRRTSVLKMVGRERHLVLLGEPGAGKTTVLRYVALCLAGATLDDPDILRLGLAQLPAWKHGKLCPVYVELREFAARVLPKPDVSGDDLLRFLLDQCRSSPALRDFTPDLERRLHAGRCIVLLDGLDEVPEAHRYREQVLAAVRGFAELFGNCRFVVTSRTYAYQRSDWRLRSFAETTLLPFTPEQVDQFVEHWYAAMTLAYPHLAGRGEQLKSEITSRPHDLGRLAERPLLLSFMASLHSRRADPLPATRANLYGDITALLLQHWEQRKRVTDPKTGQVEMEPSSLAEFLGQGTGYDDLRAAVNRVAFEVHLEQTEPRGEADIRADHVARVLHKTLERMPDRPPEYTIVKELSGRAGLLIEHDEDLYRLPHRTFQEYLAACHLCIDELFPDEIATLVADDPERWREVALLMAGEVIQNQKRQRDAWWLLKTLCPGPPPDPAPPREDARYVISWYAARAAVENRMEPTKEEWKRTLEAVRKWLAALLDAGALSVPDRAEAGRVINALPGGDPRPGVCQLDENGVPVTDWVTIPAGSFLMDNTRETDPDAYDDEAPQHTVDLPAYRISRYPATNAQYEAFVKDDGYTAKWRACWTDAGWAWKGDRDGPDNDLRADYLLSNHPRVNVTWYEAHAFGQWLGAKLGIKVRLPTEAEWEKAARGTDGRRYPWGDTFDASRCNMGDTGIGQTSAVGIFPLEDGPWPDSPLDMSGNVWEWCQSQSRDYPYNAGDGRENVNTSDDITILRVVRGGVWYGDVRAARCAHRYRLYPSSRYDSVGFRVVSASPV